jgi:hypothetical protein
MGQAVRLKQAMQIVNKSVSSTVQLSLPTTMNVPAMNMNKSSWLIYGKKKIGKTSLAARFPGALIVSFEPGAQELSVYKVDIPIGTKGNPGWTNFIKYVDLLEKTKHTFQTAVIDTGFEAYNRCLEYVCWKEGWDYPSEGKDRGIGWKKVSDEFRRQLIRLQQLNMGFVVLCHDKMLECETRAGQKFDMVVPKLSGQADDFFRATIANLAYYHFRASERFLTIRGSDYIMAGVASETRFKTVDGEDVFSIPMGRSSSESYKNLVLAFENKQHLSFENETMRYGEEEAARTVRQKAKKAQQK